MRRALGTDGVRLFKVSEFLALQQITSYFSCLAAKVRQQIPDDANKQACQGEEPTLLGQEKWSPPSPYSTLSCTISTIFMQ